MKLWKIMAVLCLASPLGAQVQIGKGVQVGGNGSGATLPTNAITYGTSSTTSRAVTTTDVSNLLQSSSGCTVAGKVYSPQSNTCVDPGTGTLSGQSVNCAPKAASSTTSTSSLPICDDGATTTLAHPVSLPSATFLGAAGEGGFVNALEGTAGSRVPTVGRDIIYSDATAHCFQYSPNGAAFTCLGQGALTGQNINFLPLATSPTASTISSHFFEASGMSGVNNPFTMTAAAPNCTAVGAGFTQFACNHMGMSDDGSSANHFLFGFSMGMNAWGPGGGYKLGDTVGFENRGNTLFGGTNMTALVTAGQKSGYYNNLSAYGLGDAQPGFNYVNNCQTGLGYSSDEGCSNRLRLGETIGEWSSTITSGTNTQPLFTADGGQCQGYENQSCAPAPGTVMIDTSVVRASGHVTSTPSSGALGLSWLSQSTTDFAPPTSTAWGFHTGINYTPSASTTWDAPVSATFLIGGGAGTFAAGDHACMIGANFTEQNIISAVSGTAPNQTITMPLVMPETDIAIFKGDCMYMDLDADAAQGVHYALAAVSVDGTNIVYTYPSHGLNLPSPIPVDGTTFSLFGADPTRSGVHLYAGARITKVGTANPGGNFPFAVPDIRVFLAPNSAFSVGDVLLNPHFAAQGVTTLDMITEQNQAPTSSGLPTGVSSSLVGKAISTFARAYFGVNANSNSLYKQYGGLLSEPRFIFQQGLFDSFALGDTTPLTSIFRFNSHQTGQTSYNILSDPSWGELSINSGSQINFSGTGGFATAGPLTGSLVTGTTGLASGVGDGGGNFAGVSMAFQHGTLTPTFLTPCSEEPFSSTNTDLCVSSHGASRSSHLAAPDRGLQAGTLTSLGNVNGVVGSFNDPAGSPLVLTSSATPSLAFIVNNTSFAGGGWAIFEGGSTNGTPGAFGYFNIATGTQPFTLLQNDDIRLIGNLSTVSGKAISWNGDTGLSRDAAGAVDVGNGTAGNFSGQLKAGDVDIFAPASGLSSAGAFGLRTLGTAISSQNQSAPSAVFFGSYWNGSAAVGDTWTLAPLLGSGTNPTSQLAIGHAGGNTGVASVGLPMTSPTATFSAAGTALPTCASGLNGFEAIVTDATAPTYMGAYTSGGAITTKVICSFNGTTYSWKTH